MTGSKRSTSVLWSALALALPLTFATFMNDTFDLPKLTLVLLAVAYGLVRQARRVTPTVWTGLEMPLAIFLACAALSTIGSLDRTVSIAGFYRVYVFGWLPMVAMALAFWLSAQDDDAERLAFMLVLGGAGAGLYGALQTAGMEPIDAMPRVIGGRPWSSLGNPIYLGAVCMMALVVTVGEFGQRRHGRLLLGLCGAAQTAGLILSLSRSAWLGAAAGIVLLGILQRRKRLFFAVGAALVLIGLSMPSARSRASHLFSLAETSNAARLEGWKGALAIARQSPLLGTGPDTFFDAFRPHRSLTYIHATGTEVTQAQAHNDELQILATMGGLGLAAFLALLGMLAVRVGRVCRTAPLSVMASLGAACLALVVQDQFNFSSVTTTAWAALCLGQLCRRAPASATPAPARGWTTIGMTGIATLLAAFALISGYADARFKSGLELRQAGQPVLALIAFRESARLRPDLEIYQTEIGNTARTLAEMSAPGSLRSSLFAEAWQAAQTNTRRHPNNPDAWNNLGVAAMWRYQLGHEATLPEARAAFEHAVQLDPLFVDAWANLAKWRHVSGDIPGEKDLWRKVLTIDPQYPMAHQVLGV